MFDGRWKVYAVEVEELYYPHFRVSLHRRTFTISSCEGAVYKGRSAVNLDSGAQISGFFHSLLSYALYTDSLPDNVEFVRSLISNGVSPTRVPLHESVSRLARKFLVRFWMKERFGRLMVAYGPDFSPLLVLKDKSNRQCNFLLLLVLPQRCIHKGGGQFAFQPVILDGTQLPEASFSVPLSVLKLLTCVVKFCDVENLRRFVVEHWSQLAAEPPLV